MIQPLTHWFLAALLAGIVAISAHRLQKLSTSGSVAAVVLGSMIVGTGGWWPGIILVIFFATSSLLSRTDVSQARGSRRDWVQVLANGWALLLGCVLYALSGWQPWLLFGIGAIAAATADTWSSEIGRRNPSPPRLITNGKVVAAGTSGAITLYGSLAALAGSAVIAGATSLAIGTGAFTLQSSAFTVFIGVTTAGISGAMLDSVLGATIQERRWCDNCNKATESNPHLCGAETRQFAGVSGFNNDVVNMCCVLTGALIGLVSGIL